MESNVQASVVGSTVEKGRIQVSVSADHVAAPLANALVSVSSVDGVYSYSRHTDAKGTTSFSFLTDNEYLVTAEKVGFVTFNHRTTLTDDSSKVELRFILARSH